MPILSSDTVTSDVLAVVETAGRNVDGPRPAARFMVPCPPPTEKNDAEPFSDHAPPVSAVPQPDASVRAKASCARTPAEATVTARLWGVAPLLSVTVRVTVYVPPDA